MHITLRTASDRSALRRELRFPCQVVEEHEFTLLASECLDLSLSGMGVLALEPAPIGTSVIVSFRVPGGSLYIDTEAIVTRVAWSRRRSDRGLRLGLTFVR